MAHNEDGITTLLPSKSASPNNQLHSPLLRLPQELRDLIYFYVFEADENYIRLDVCGPLDAPLFRDCCGPVDDSHASQVSGLVLSCRSIYIETIGLYYSTSIFYMYNVNAGMRHLANLPKRHREAMLDVRACTSPRAEGEIADHTYKPWREHSLRRLRARKMDVLIVGLKMHGIVMAPGVLKMSPAPAIDKNPQNQKAAQGSLRN